MKLTNLKIPQWFILIAFLISLIGCGQSTPVQEEIYTPSDDEYEPGKIVVDNLRLGVEYMKLGKYGDALAKLKKVLSLDENYADGHSAIAILYDKRLGQYGLAQQHYERALALKPMDSDVQNNYGQFLCKQGRWQEAEQHFLKAIENPVYQTPEYPLVNASICAKQHGNSEKAELYLRRALLANSRFPFALYQMAKLSYDTQRYKEAQDYLQRYSAIAEHTPETLWLGIQIAKVMGDRSAETNYVTSLRSKFPDSEEVYLLNRQSATTQ